MDHRLRYDEISCERLRKLELEIEELDQMIYNLQVERAKVTLRIRNLLLGKGECRVIRADIAA